MRERGCEGFAFTLRRRKKSLTRAFFRLSSHPVPQLDYSASLSSRGGALRSIYGSRGWARVVVERNEMKGDIFEEIHKKELFEFREKRQINWSWSFQMEWALWGGVGELHITQFLPRSRFALCIAKRIAFLIYRSEAHSDRNIA